MRYKAKYSPSEIVCPETFDWVPVPSCLPLLDKSKYSRLSPPSRETSQPVEVDSVGILYRRQAMQVGMGLILLVDSEVTIRGCAVVYCGLLSGLPSNSSWVHAATLVSNLIPTS